MRKGLYIRFKRDLMNHLKRTKAYIMKNFLTSYYTVCLLNETRKNGKIRTMKAVKLHAKLKELNK